MKPLHKEDLLQISTNAGFELDASELDVPQADLQVVLDYVSDLEQVEVERSFHCRSENR